jgi:hypothetical protein
MKFWLLVVSLLFTSCATSVSRSTLVFDYSDFGPQAMAYRLIGPKNHQWDPASPIPLGDPGVRVVVYRGVRLEDVQRLYPVVEENKQDYRYLHYEEALAYLDARIEQNLLRRVTERLQLTRDRILHHLN